MNECLTHTGQYNSGVSMETSLLFNKDPDTLELYGWRSHDRMDLLAADRLLLNLMWIHLWRHRRSTQQRWTRGYSGWTAWRSIGKQRHICLNKGCSCSFPSHPPSPPLPPPPSPHSGHHQHFFPFDWRNQEIKPGGKEYKKAVCCFLQVLLLLFRLLLLVGGVWVEEQSGRESVLASFFCFRWWLM